MSTLTEHGRIAPAPPQRYTRNEVSRTLPIWRTVIRVTVPLATYGDDTRVQEITEFADQGLQALCDALTTAFPECRVLLTCSPESAHKRV